MNELNKKTSLDKKIDLIITVILSVSIVSVAWCAYQSTLWSGIQTFAIKESNGSMQQFILNTIQQSQYSTIDVITFIEYVNALNNNDEKSSEFYYQRLRPDFKPAVEAWLKTNPFENPSAPPHPFVMSEYRKTFSEDAEQFLAKSTEKTEEAVTANGNSDSYVLLTVIFSVLLFMGGIQKKVKITSNIFLLISCIVTFSLATISMLSLPIAPKLLLG
ncbi:MAG TPA: hypothetical protein VMW74_01925 [Nitrosopumilaceae archaeon]|nr:hypothetical protein [Nitrosopumilaceae archaeon]